ncbi:MAG TPA: hypothetical protein VI980_10870 [Acidimicrobiia bacterium]|nr:hypothetical protein [Acidimicrobiia bacterium]
MGVAVAQAWRGWFELEAHCEPPRTSRETKFTQAARRPHQFKQLESGPITVHYDFGRKGEPEELHLERKGLRKGTHRIEERVHLRRCRPAAGSERGHFALTW